MIYDRRFVLWPLFVPSLLTDPAWRCGTVIDRIEDHQLCQFVAIARL